MWNLVGFVKCRYGRDEGGDGSDYMAGKSSVFAVRQWGFWWNIEGGVERGGGGLLGLKLVGKNQICVAKKIFVDGDYILLNIKMTFIAHDWIQYCRRFHLSILESIKVAARSLTQLTPEKGTWLLRRIQHQVPSYGANSLDRIRTGRIA